MEAKGVIIALGPYGPFIDAASSVVIILGVIVEAASRAVIALSPFIYASKGVIIALSPFVAGAMDAFFLLDCFVALSSLVLASLFKLMPRISLCPKGQHSCAIVIECSPDK